MMMSVFLDWGWFEYVEINYKIIIWRIMKLLSSIMVIKNLLVCKSLDKKINCAQERHITPCTPYL
jgi:hypothetical protein